MKTIIRILAIVLVMAMITTTALAMDWVTFQKDNAHNGVITDDAPTSSTPDIDSLELTNNGSGWDGIDTAPIMQTVSGTTYAYILYDGYTVSGANGGARLAKINCDTQSEVWSKQVSPSAGFQLSTPLLVQGANANSEADDTIYLASTGFTQLLDNDELYNITPNPWTVGGSGVQGAGYVSITGNNAATLTQSSFSVDSTPTNRAAVGVYVGDSDTPGIAMTVTVALNGSTVVTESFTTSSTAIEDGDTGDYYYYVNTNFAAGSYTAPITVTVDVTDGNAGNTVNIEYVRLYQQSGSIQAVTDLDEATPTTSSIITGISGQINTPITTDGTYIYFGTWSGTYYQVRLSDYNTLTFTTGTGGFYWAGAVVLGNFVYFGSDNGTLYARAVAAFNTYGHSTDISTDGSVSGGNIRSTILAYDGDLYFTSQGGYLWKYTPDVYGDPQYVDHIAISRSTSTPVVSDNGYMYVGCSSGVYKVNASTFSGESLIISGTGIAVYGSVLSYSDGSTDYLYFTTNSYAAPGGYCYSYDGSTASSVWDTTSSGNQTYTLQGMAASDGYVVFGNDYDYAFIIHD